MNQPNNQVRISLQTKLLATIALILAVVLAGYLTTDTAVGGVIEFFIVFFGGILVGWVAAPVGMGSAVLAGLAAVNHLHILDLHLIV